MAKQSCSSTTSTSAGVFPAWRYAPWAARSVASARDFREKQIAAFKDKTKLPSWDEVQISDDEFRASVSANQLRIQKERGDNEDMKFGKGKDKAVIHYNAFFTVRDTA